jgi:hypothetical protein
MDWRGEQELGRMLLERIRRFRGRWDNRANWYELGFRDGWELALGKVVEKLESEAKNEVKRTERKTYGKEE